MKSILTFLFFALMPTILFAQSDPVLIIDGTTTTFKSGLSFPYWLKAGQTINLGTNVKSISALEFTIDSANLKFSQVLSITNLQTVPAGKAWKLEALGFGGNGQTTGGFSTASAPSIFISPKIFNEPGTFDWIVPPSVTSICVEVWGAGGSTSTNFGGGGGAYGYECFSVIPGTHYTIIVGTGGTYSNNSAGESSSLGNLIIANGGSNGPSGGIGGTSTAQFNLQGGNGSINNGGKGANGSFYGNGSPNNGYNANGGQVIIYW